MSSVMCKAAYMDDQDGTLRKADEARNRETYESSGIELNPDGVVQELVAEATEKIIEDRNGDIISRLLSQNERGMLVRLRTKLGEFLARQKAKREGSLERYNAIRDAYRQLTDALQKKGKWSPEDSGTDPTVDLDTQTRNRGDVAHGAQGEQMQFALVQDESGWPMVKADRDFRLSDNPKEWGKQIRDYIRDEIRKKEAIEIRTLDGETLILDSKSQIKAKDWLSGVDEERNRARKNAFAHIDEVVEASEDMYPGEMNTPDEFKTHPWASDGWRYREAVFEDYSGKRYLLEISVGYGDDGKYIYNIGNVLEIKKRTTSSVSGQQGRVPSDLAEAASSSAYPRSGSSDTSIADANANVNPYAMPERRSVHGLSG